MLNMQNIKVPASVPAEQKAEYQKNYLAITKNSGRLMLFAGDQKIEHLNDDFYGEGISADDADPIHLFNIAANAKIGVFAAQLGLISRYGADFKEIPYLIKLNSKTHLVPKNQSDPKSPLINSVAEVVEFKKNSGLNILGIGYTIYYGSAYEGEMIREASQAILEAHKNGLVAVIWAYPRGKAVENEKDSHLIAGAAGATACLGADFVKVNPPKADNQDSSELLKEAVKAAGRTGVVCAGGSNADVKEFLTNLYNQIHLGGAAGNATGRNIHQKDLAHAIRFTNAIYAITVEGRSIEEALEIYHG